MIASQLRPRIALAILLLATALVLFGTRSHAVLAQGSTDNVQDIDLAKMVLPLSAYGPEYAELALDPQSGFRTSADPSGITKGYTLVFGNSNAAQEPFPFLNISLVGLFDSPDEAVSQIAEGIAEAADNYGDLLTTFPVISPAGATGYTIRIPSQDPSFLYAVTGVIFPSDRLIGATLFFRPDESDINTEVIVAANALNDRMKGVLTGKVTDFPAPLPPDVNCNGDVDSIDASLVLQLGAGLVASLPCGALGDANQDGHTNAIDASLILQYSAGLIDQLPVPG